MPSDIKYIGYLKYTGKRVDDGLMDARKQAQALIGFDEALRFYVRNECPELVAIEFEIPVRIQKGSWKALIPETIEQWITVGAGLATSSYLVAAAKKMAENDFKDIGLKDIFIKALRSIQWFIKIGSHLGNLTQKKFEKLKWQNDNKEIGIPNDKQEYLYVPKEHFDAFVAAYPKLISNMADIIEEERELSVGVIDKDLEEEVKVTLNKKHIFTSKEEETEDVLFPEFVHGQYVELSGNTTRGNENANSIGFKYNDHILTCYPAKGSIVSYKKALFLKCKIYGHIDRADKFGKPTEKRPKIIFTDLEVLKNESADNSLF